MHKKLILASALLSAFAFQAHAQSTDLDDRWEISGSYFRPGISISGQADLTGTDGEEVANIAESGKAGGGMDGARFEASYRLSQRQKLVAGWYGVGRGRDWGFSEQGTFAPEDVDLDPVDYSIDGRAGLDSEFELYRLSYGYDFIQSDRFSMAGLVGVYRAKLDVKGRTQGTGEVDGEAFEWSDSARWQRTRHAPGIGLAASYRPADKWDIRAQAQGFKTSWGDFDTDGHFVHASAEVGYRLSPTWSAFAGYDWFKLKLEYQVSGAAAYEGGTYTVSGPAAATLKVHGPTIGVRAHF